MVYAFGRYSLPLNLAVSEKNGEGGIRTRGTGVYPYDGLANRCLKPLGHLSERYSIIYSMQADVARI